MIILYTRNEEVVERFNTSSVIRLDHTLRLDEERYISEVITVELPFIDDVVRDETEYISIPKQDEEFKHDLFWVKDIKIINDQTHITGVLAGIEELSKTPVYDVRPQDQTIRAAAEQVLNGTNYTVRFAEKQLKRTTNAYYTSVWDVLKKYCEVWNVEMKITVEVSNDGIAARYIDFYDEYGVDSGARVVYGHNALEILLEDDKAEIYTALIGRGNGERVGETEDGEDTYGRKINFSDIEWKTSAGDPLDKPIGQLYLELPSATALYGYKKDGQLHPKIGFVDINTDDRDDLIQRTYETLLTVSRPSVMMQTSSAYLDGNIGDSVRVVREDIDLYYQTRIFEITWDRLTDYAFDIKLGDNLVESSKSASNKIVAEAREEAEDVVDRAVAFVVSASGKNTNFYGAIDPRNEGHIPKVNDVWYQTVDDITTMYIWNGESWEMLVTDARDDRVGQLVEDLQELVNRVDTNVVENVQDLITLLDGAREVDLDDVFARIVSNDRYSSLFYQEAEGIGLVWAEGGEMKSIIAIQDGMPYIKGENIILNGDTVVDGDFTVTEQMISPQVIVDRLIANGGIDASQIRVINLDASNISGGNLELANGLKITNNGAVVMEVTSDGRFRFDATAAGVATKQELEDIELTPGPEGPQGPPGYTPIKGTDYFDGVDGQDGKDGDNSYLWVMYSQNANGSGMVDNPTNAIYIGVATTTSPTRPSSTSAYKWSLIKGDDGVEGEKGSDGRTSYLHIKYSNDGGQTFTANNGEAVGDWIGTYVDFTQADSNNVSDYTWNKVKGDKGATGDKGAKGDQGIQGPKGANGQSQYVHVRYSANSTGSGHVAKPTTSTKYIGIAVTNTNTLPTALSAYTWSKYQGDDGSQGPQGIKGDKGANGEPTYTWVKYADTPTSGMDNFPEGKKYIGLAFNKTTATESSTYSQYAWSLMPQNIALGVRNLVPWTDFTDYENNISKWRPHADATLFPARQEGKYAFFRNENTNRTGSGRLGITSLPYYKDVESGRTYTLRFIGVASSEVSTPFDYCFLMNTDRVERDDVETDGNQGLPTPEAIVNYESFSGLTASHANLYTITFTAQFTGRAEIMIGSVVDLSQTSNHYVGEVMIVEGDSISSDWAPAPEDIDRLMHDSVDEKVGGLQSELSVHWEAIDDKVSINAFTEAMDNMKKDYEAGLIEASQVPQEIQNILSRHEAITNNLGDKVEQWNFIDTHMRAGNEGLYIGEIDGDSALLIGTDRISFMQGQEEIAYISGQQMFINRSINVESMQVGSHIFQKIDNNSTVIAWVGG